MRSHYLLLGSLIFLFSTIELIGQNQVDAPQLAGGWHLDFQRTLSNMPNVDQVRLTSIPKEANDRLEASYANRDYTFSEDGTYYIDYNNGTNNYEAKWEMVNDKTIKITGNQGNIEFYEVISLTNTSLILEVKSGNPAAILIKKLYLTKI